MPRANRWIDAAVLTSIFTALAVQRIRFEAFETEKTGLLLLLAGIIGVGLLHNGVMQRATTPSLLTIIVLAIVLWAGGITPLALSPRMALWGAPYRGQGWLALLAGVMLFWGASRLSDAGVKAIGTALCLTAIPMCAIAWISRLGLDAALPMIERPPSTAGNVNFLSNWLAMALVLIVPMVGGSQRRLAIFSGLIMVVTLVMTGGRAALLSLALASLCGGLLWWRTNRATANLRWSKKWLIPLLIAIGIGVYAISAQATRLFNWDDPARLALWRDGLRLVGQMNQPFTDAYGNEDRLGHLRPIIGYGLDNLEQTHTRLVDTPYYLSSYIDRFHNQLLDTLLSQGWPGLALQLALYGAALYTGLKALKHTPDRPNLTVICLIMLVIQQGIANQFGFTQTIGQTLWWIALGLLIRQPDEVPEVEAKPSSWLLLPPCLFLLHTFGSFALGIVYGSWVTGAVLVALTLIIGGIALLPGWHRLMTMTLMLAGFGIMVFLLRTGGGSLFQSGVERGNIIITVFGAGIFALSGLIVVGLSIGVFVGDDIAFEGVTRRMLLSSAILLLCLLLYSVPFTGSALHRLGDNLATMGYPDRALWVLDLARIYAPVDNRIYLSRARIQWVIPQADPLETARQETARLIADEPFMANERDVYDLRRSTP